MKTEELAGLAQLAQAQDGKTSSQENLIKAFSLFTQETEKLKKSYDLLKKEFLRLKQELENKDEKLKEKIVELNGTSLYLNNLLQNIKQGILFITGDGFITTCNAFAEHLLNKKREELLLQEYASLFADDFFGFSMQKVLSTHSPPPLKTISLTSSQGGEKFVEVSVSFVKEDQIFQKGVIVLLKDVSEVRRLKVIAERNDRMKELGEMAAQVAHEIRNPLGGIRGFAALLCRDLESNPSQKKLADYIVEGANRLNSLVTEVLDYARPLEAVMEACKPAELIASLQDSLQEDPLFKERITFKNHLDAPITLEIDREMVRRTLLNLYVNAAQATQEAGMITTFLKIESGSAAITIRDSGCGIAKEHLEHIFSPFFTTKMEGTGFGLSEAYKIMQAHGGEIDVESEKNKGTVFTLRFPVS